MTESAFCDTLVVAGQLGSIGGDDGSHLSNSEKGARYLAHFKLLTIRFPRDDTYFTGR